MQNEVILLGADVDKAGRGFVGCPPHSLRAPALLLGLLNVVSNVMGVGKKRLPWCL